MYNTVTIKSRATLGLRDQATPPQSGQESPPARPGDSGWAVQVDHRMKRDTHRERGLVEAPRRSPRVDVDHSGGRLPFSPWPSKREPQTTPLPLRPWTGIRKSGVVDSSLCQGGQKVLIPVPERRQQKMEGRFLRGQFIYDVRTYTIVRSYIGFGNGEWERREGVGGSWGPEFVLD